MSYEARRIILIFLIPTLLFLNDINGLIGGMMTGACAGLIAWIVIPKEGPK